MTLTLEDYAEALASGEAFDQLSSNVLSPFKILLMTCIMI